MTATAVKVVQLLTLGQTKLGDDFDRPKAVAFLAYLALEGRQSRQAIAELFWEGSTDPQNSLRNQIYQLKPHLESALVVSRQFIELKVDFDVFLLQHHLEQNQFEQATQTYKGEFLAGFQAPQGSQLEEWLYSTRKFIKRQIIEAHLKLGEFALEQTKRQQLQHHLEEAQAIAISTDKATQHWFQARLSYLEQQVATQSTQLAPNNLFIPNSEFIGRNHEINATLDRFNSTAQMITFLGFGGIGKTRLSLETARSALNRQRYLDGIYFVALENVFNAAQMQSRIVQTLNIPIQGTQDLDQQIKNHIGQKNMLLVLDNLEQLTEETPLLSDLLENCPNLRLLCTSREVLGLHAEHVYPIQGLDTQTPEGGAVQLFLARAKQEFAPTEQEQILEICRLLQGIPLAIELAVPQLQNHSLPALLTTLQQNMDALYNSNPDLPERQRSIRAVFLHSWKLLNSTERQALRRMAIFKNGANRQALLAIGDVTLSHIATLIDKSFVERAGQQRYTIHPLILEYSLEELEKESEFEQIQTKHAHFYLDETAKEMPHIRGAEAARIMQKIETDFDNLQTAWAWALENKDYSRVSGVFDMVVFFEHRSWLLQGIQFFEDALIFARGYADIEIFANLAVNVAWLKFCYGSNDSAIKILEDIVVDIHRYKNETLKSKIYNTLGNIYLVKQELQKALNSFEISISFISKDENLNRYAIILGNKAKVYLALDDFMRSREAHSEVLYIAKIVENKYMELTAIIALSSIELYLVDYPNFEFLSENLIKGYQFAVLNYDVLVGYFEFYISVMNFRIGNITDAEYWIYRLLLRNDNEITTYLRVDGKILLSEILIEKKIFSEAKNQINQAFRDSINTGNIIQVFDCKITYIKYYFAINLHEKAHSLGEKLLRKEKINFRQSRELHKVLSLGIH